MWHDKKNFSDLKMVFFHSDDDVLRWPVIFLIVFPWDFLIIQILVRNEGAENGLIREAHLRLNDAIFSQKSAELRWIAWAYSYNLQWWNIKVHKKWVHFELAISVNFGEIYFLNEKLLSFFLTTIIKLLPRILTSIHHHSDAIKVCENPHNFHFLFSLFPPTTMMIWRLATEAFEWI